MGTWSNCLQVSFHLLNALVFCAAGAMAAQGVLGLLWLGTGQINQAPAQPSILYLLLATAGALMFTSIWVLIAMCMRRRWMLLAYWAGQAGLMGCLIGLLVVISRYSGAEAQFWQQLAGSLFSVRVLFA